MVMKKKGPLVVREGLEAVGPSVNAGGEER